jgi:hypothetical protein
MRFVAVKTEEQQAPASLGAAEIIREKCGTMKRIRAHPPLGHDHEN